VDEVLQRAFLSVGFGAACIGVELLKLYREQIPSADYSWPW
jgi:hypothetical protein